MNTGIIGQHLRTSSRSTDECDFKSFAIPEARLPGLFLPFYSPLSVSNCGSLGDLITAVFPPCLWFQWATLVIIEKGSDTQSRNRVVHPAEGNFPGTTGVYRVYEPCGVPGRNS